MLKITVPLSESFNHETNRFVIEEGFDMELEHSLVSLSKWESREEIPFLAKNEKTEEQLVRYIQDMTLTPDVPPDIFKRFSKQNHDDVNAYINANMTATTFRELNQQRPSREIITAEIIYYWMVSMQIDFQCQYWHLNRLLTLVRVINEKNKANQPKKFGRNSAAQRQQMNRARQAEYGTTG